MGKKGLRMLSCKEKALLLVGSYTVEARDCRRVVEI
jgi:hypothetical protein